MVNDVLATGSCELNPVATVFEVVMVLCVALNRYETLYC